MQAIVQEKFGPPDVLSLREIDRPSPNDDQVLLRVHAASVNPYDWHMMRAQPYLMRLFGVGFLQPKNKILGADATKSLAGVPGR